jgi:hypothetical protein
MRFKQAIAVFLMLAVVTCSAQTRREEEPLCDRQGPSRVEIQDGDATIMGFAIGRTSLEDVEAMLGKAQVERVSHEEESDVVICYLSPTDGTVLAFYSGAMGGWNYVTRFALWSREGAFPNASRCAKSSKISRHLFTVSGLGLGLTAAELKRIAGTPNKVADSSMKYDYICRQKMTDDEIKGFKTANNWDVTSDPYFDRMSWIDVHFKNEMASRIEIGRIESY